MKRLMSREMLRELLILVEPHKEKHPDLYAYLATTWTACKYNSTLYAMNVTGAIVGQYHLQEFDESIETFYRHELDETGRVPLE